MLWASSEHERLAPLAAEAGKAKNYFQNDAHLVHGTVTVENMSVPPDPYGTYSIRLADPDRLDFGKAYKAKVFVVTCMDGRVAKPVYDHIKTQFGVGEDQILTLAIAGGAVQDSPDDPLRTKRQTSFKAQLAYIEALASNLEHVVLTAHTSDPDIDGSHPCGGITYMSGKRRIDEALKPEVAARLLTNYPGKKLEASATEMLMSSAAAMLPKRLKDKASGFIVYPWETEQDVQMSAVDLKAGCAPVFLLPNMKSMEKR